MDVEKHYIQQCWKQDQTHGPGHKVFNGVQKWLRHVTQNVPELGNRVDANQQDHKETHKFD